MKNNNYKIIEIAHFNLVFQYTYNIFAYYINKK